MGPAEGRAGAGGSGLGRRRGGGPRGAETWIPRYAAGTPSDRLVPSLLRHTIPAGPTAYSPDPLEPGTGPVATRVLTERSSPMIPTVGIPPSGKVTTTMPCPPSVLTGPLSRLARAGTGFQSWPVELTQTICVMVDAAVVDAAFHSVAVAIRTWSVIRVTDIMASSAGGAPASLTRVQLDPVRSEEHT